jgi:hypothetical protein
VVNLTAVVPPACDSSEGPPPFPAHFALGGPGAEDPTGVAATRPEPIATARLQCVLRHFTFARTPRPGPARKKATR